MSVSEESSHQQNLAVTFRTTRDALSDAIEKAPGANMMHSGLDKAKKVAEDVLKGAVNAVHRYVAPIYNEATDAPSSRFTRARWAARKTCAGNVQTGRANGPARR